jgi:probable HAF family extracellular repeat protein
MRHPAFLCVVCAACGARAVAAPPKYAITDLGAAPHFAPIFGHSVNSNGIVLGEAERFFTIPNGGGGSQERAYLITPTEQHEILIFNGNVQGWAINSHGQVAGTGVHYSMRRAFVWQHDQWTMLSTLGGGWSWANSMNDLGQVVGGSYIDRDDAISHAALWQPDGTIVDLGTLSGEMESAGMAVNNRGQVVGSSDVSGNAPVAYIWEDGKMTALPRPSPQRYTVAVDINDDGVIAGYAEWQGENYYAPLAWKDREVIELPLPTGRPIGQAEAVNSAGAIVGYATSWIYDPQGYRAVLWVDDQVIDLNGSIAPNSGWLLTHAADISDAGHIVGHGFLNGEPRGFLLTPTLSTALVRD